ncbi:glucose/mannose transport system substrate-binding protein [Bowdeniella nasicola]|uniref:Probable sugar-binding periplasmic protein n=1 Tax=Bowdeniella nasicola TaxID=208480 RepID=A0A1H3YXL4_9ACTO|nr:extracellular solute-binding protein [Bowdeniella nasicola]SEA16303.1 glucose/mannose transport system substrate-binding protein [Bowdeniella nasicola]
MKRIGAVAGLAALSLVLAACGGGGSSNGSTTGGSGGGSGEGGGDVSVVSWWEAGSEKKGLEALEGVFKKEHPNFTFKNAAVAGGGGSQAKQKLAADLAAKNPPDTFQAHAGAELTDYIDAMQIEDVSNLYDEFKLKDAFPQTLIDRLTVDGKIYSVPSNVHRANVVWANNAVLKEAGLDPEKAPADLDAWIADMEKVKAAGKTPITVGMAWTQLQLLEVVLMADLGAEGYNGLFDGKTAWDGPEVTKAIEHYAKIMELADKSYLNEDWEPAMNPVISGNAAYNVMGDWAVAAFDAAGKKYKEDYVAFPVPGTDGMFDFLADSFTLPVGAKNVDGAKAWLQTISGKEGQIAFNTVKGSIPARSDLSEEELGKFGEYQQDAMKSFAEDTIVSSIAHGAAAPVAVSNAMNDACAKFAQGGSDVAGFQAELAKAAEPMSK